MGRATPEDDNKKDKRGRKEKTVRLYMAASTDYAKHVIEHGFMGVPRDIYRDEDLQTLPHAGKESLTQEEFAEQSAAVQKLPSQIGEFCEFRDMPPGGFTLSRTAEVQVDEEPGGLHVEISGGHVLVDDLGDFILCIEVPEEVALRNEAHEDPPAGWPFREFWLAPEETNRYVKSLKVFDSRDGKEVRLDLVGK